MAGIIGKDANNKSKNGLTPLLSLIPYVLRYRTQVIAALVFLLLAALTTLVLPLAVRRVIDHGFTNADSGLVNSYFALLAGVALLLAFFSSLRFYFVTWLGEAVVSDLRSAVFERVTKLSPSFFDTAQSGEIVSRLASDTAQLKSVMGSSASFALRNVIMGIGAVGAMAFTSPKLAAITLGVIPLIAGPLIFYGRAVRKRSRLAQDRLADATAYATEQIGAVRTLQAFTNEGLVNARYAGAVTESLSAIRDSIKSRSTLTFFAISISFSSIVGVLWVGSRDVMTGVMTAGTLSQFLLYAVIAAGAVGALSEFWNEVNQAAGATERLVELTEIIPDVRTPENPVALPLPPLGTVAFENVSFAYPARPERTVVRGLSFSIKAGETVAFVGLSGAGKSTLFALMLRFYDPSSGRILIDGIDARNAALEPLRQRMAFVAQDVTVFSSSVADNIAFGRPGASRADIEAAADAAHATEFIQALPEGYNTLLGERGVTLSGGQRQRIAIARAILRDAPILLLDEATSALDAESETAVQNALDGLTRNRTTLIIAHRLATILKADRILVMDGGQIVEQGTHQSLVASGGVYARLARLQFDDGISAFARAAE
jgi:ATP-binding cassette, subfamily B, bacterial